MKQYFSLRTRIPNTKDGLECLPASLAMSMDILRGQALPMEQAKAVTGYRPGVETWPYRMLSWLAAEGFEVKHIDAIDARSFAVDPLAELRKGGFDEKTIDYFVSITDFEEESAAINDALRRGVIFEARLPAESDLVEYLETGWLPILTLDAAVLTDQVLDGYQGHMILVTGQDPVTGDLLVQDSGLPDHWDWQVPVERVFRALKTPAESSGTISLIRLVERGGEDHGA